MLKSFISTLLISMVLILPGTLAQAHPHVFIEQKTELIFDEKGLAGFKVTWAFDEMFSTMIMEDHDLDKNGKLSPGEVAVIEKEAFGYIAKYHYYLSVKIDGKPFVVNYIRDFNARLEKGKLLYDFLVPCHVTAIPQGKEIMISPYDSEYYSALYFPDKNPVTLNTPDQFQVDTEIKTDKTTSFYYGMVNPYALFITLRTAP
ncbi:MAG: DUF1007 family protein [Desulfobacterales bacterium]|nr:DUF1007 family protein [Desulfobacterales bacterium]